MERYKFMLSAKYPDLGGGVLRNYPMHAVRYKDRQTDTDKGGGGGQTQKEQAEKKSTCVENTGSVK